MPQQGPIWAQHSPTWSQHGANILPSWDLRRPNIEQKIMVLLELRSQHRCSCHREATRIRTFNIAFFFPKPAVFTKRTRRNELRPSNLWFFDHWPLLHCSLWASNPEGGICIFCSPQLDGKVGNLEWGKMMYRNPGNAVLPFWWVIVYIYVHGWIMVIH